MRKALPILLLAVLLGVVVSRQVEQPPARTIPAAAETASPIAPDSASAGSQGPDAMAPDRMEVPRFRPPEPSDQDSLSGIVVDEFGTPVSGVPLTASAENPLDSNGDASITDEQGRFRILHRLGFRDHRVGIAIVRSRRSGFRLLSESPPYRWGTAGIHLVVRRPQTWILNVVEAGTGLPLEVFDWRCEPPMRQGWGDQVGGRAEIKDLEYGRHRVLVFPRDDQVVPEWEDFEVGPVGGKILIAVQRRRPLVVRVQFPDGVPVHGAEVEVLRSHRVRPLRLDTIAGPADVNSRKSVDAWVLHTGLTDVWGEVTLLGPHDEALGVRVRGPGHAPVLIIGVSITAGSDPLVIEVPRGATLEGTVHPMSTVKALAGDKTPRQLASRPFGLILIRESNTGTQQFPIEHQQPMLIQDDGSFRAEHVPPGDWEVHLSYWWSSTGSGGITASLQRHHRLGSVTLEENGMERIALDLSTLSDRQ